MLPWKTHIVKTNWASSLRVRRAEIFVQPLWHRRDHTGGCSTFDIADAGGQADEAFIRQVKLFIRLHVDVNARYDLSEQRSLPNNLPTGQASQGGHLGGTKTD